MHVVSGSTLFRGTPEVICVVSAGVIAGPTHVYNNKTERQTIEMLSQRLLTRACVLRMRLALLNCPAAQRRRIGANAL